MVGQAAMNNGKTAPRSMDASVAPRAAGLVRELLLLLELQARLLGLDARDFGRCAVAPCIAIIAAVVALLAAMTVALLGLAYLLVDEAGLSRVAALLLTAVLCLGGSALVAVVSLRRLRAAASVFRRSQEELHTNMCWLKEMLERRN
jgi:hypothetical protein